jgi:hypothetical protein
MNIELFEGIRAGNRAVEGNALYEAATGRTTASVQIAKDWVQALKDIVANKADALKVIAEFDKRIDAEVAKGDLADIYAQIRQQMPDTTDLGLVAANIQSVEEWLTQGGSRNESTVKESLTGKSKGKSKIKTRGEDALTGDDTPMPDLKSRGEATPTPGDDTTIPKWWEGMGDGASYTSTTRKPSKINASGDTPAISKTKLNYTDSDALDAFNQNDKGTVGDEIVEGRRMARKTTSKLKSRGEATPTPGDDTTIPKWWEGYYADENDNVFYVFEDGQAYYVDESYEPIDADEAFIGNVYEDTIYGEKLIEDTGVEDDSVYPYELFEDNDGDVVYYNEAGDLFYATDEDIEEAIAADEDINIYYNKDGDGDDGDAVGAMPPDGVANQDVGNAPQEPMQVELINNGESGEVSSVIIDVAGKHIEIGPDGVVNEQPAGGGAPASAGGNMPQQKTMQEGYSKARHCLDTLSSFLSEDNDNYTDVAKRTPRTTTGGEFRKGINYIDPEALDAMNSGGDINGSKSIEEQVDVNELFEDEDGDLVYYDESGNLCYATDEDKAQWVSEESGDGTEVSSSSAPGGMDNVKKTSGKTSVHPDVGTTGDYKAPAPMTAAKNYGHSNSVNANTNEARSGFQDYRKKLEIPKGTRSPDQYHVPSAGTIGDTQAAFGLGSQNGRNAERQAEYANMVRGKKTNFSDMDDSERAKSDLANRYKGKDKYLNGLTMRVNKGKYKPNAGKLEEAAGDYDHITMAAGLGKSLRAPEGRMATDQFETSMVDSGATGNVSTPETPQQYYDLGNKDFRGKPVGAKDRKKPDQNSEPEQKYEDISNMEVFNALTRHSKAMQESWKAKEDIDAEHGVQPNKN